MYDIISCMMSFDFTKFVRDGRLLLINQHDELGCGFKYVFFLLSVPKLVKKSQFYPKGFGGVTTSRHHFHALLGTWISWRTVVGVEDLTFASTPKPFRFPDLTQTDWFHFINHFDRGRIIVANFPCPSCPSIFAQVNEEEFLRIMKKTNLFWGPGDSSQQHRQFWSFLSFLFANVCISRINKYENTWKYVLYCEFAWILLPTQKLNPQKSSCLKKIKTTCLFNLWVTPYLIFVWALFSDRCGCCFADLSRTPGVWIKRSNGQCWFQMRTFAISEQKLLLQLQPIGS